MDFLIFFLMFLFSFRMLSESTAWSSDHKENTKKIVTDISSVVTLEGIQYGKTKIFLKVCKLVYTCFGF